MKSSVWLTLERVNAVHTSGPDSKSWSPRMRPVSVVVEPVSPSTTVWNAGVAYSSICVVERSRPKLTSRSPWPERVSRVPVPPDTVRNCRDWSG